MLQAHLYALFFRLKANEVRCFWDDYCGILAGSWNAVLKLLSHRNKRSADLKKNKPAGLVLVSVIHIKLRSFEMSFQNVNKICSALKHLVLSTPK